MMKRARRAQKPAEVVIGSAVLSKAVNSEALDARFEQGALVRISKSMRAPDGSAYFKLFGTKCWVNDTEVHDVTVGAEPPRHVRYKQVYTVGD
jgi:hypothetical protein